MEPGASESPETGAMRAETRRLLEKSIDALPAVFRTVFVLRALDVDLAFAQAFSFDGARCERIVAGVLERLKLSQ